MTTHIMTKHQKEMLINEEKLAGPNTRFEFGRYKRSEFYKGHKCGD